MSVRLCDNSVGTSLQRITYVVYRALCLEGYLGFIGISRPLLRLRWIRLPSLARSKPEKRLSMLPRAQHEFYKLTHSETNLKRLGFHGGGPPSL